jgi:D-alanyl-D-alanine carboxypeptidase/D-alanyl-D-alanine-endopeptidase (penicillin-binding protein 4)
MIRIETMKNILILFFVVLLTIRSQDRLEEIYNDGMEEDYLRHAQWSLYAAYASTGEELINISSEESLAPASGLKLLISAAALEILGDNFRFITKVYTDGEVDNEGKLMGNLYFTGSGDPTLGSTLVEGSRGLDELYADIAEKFNMLGIKSIEGDIAADDFYFDRDPIPGNWYWIDIGNYYGAQASALTIHDNLYYLYFQPGKNVGDPTKVLRTEPVIDGLRFENLITTGKRGSGDNGYIYAAPNQYNAVLRGTIPAGSKEFSIKGSIPDPPLFAVKFLKKTLNENNIEVRGSAVKSTRPPDYSEMTLLYTIESPPLKDIIYILNKRSNNLYTEQLLRTIARAKGKEGGLYEGIEVLEDFLDSLNIDRSAMQLYDGCGLSRSNMISSRILAELLMKMKSSKYFDTYYNSLAVAGDPKDIGFFSYYGSGTKVAKNARIKSGLIDRVRSHSGYINDSNGEMIAFSFIANNFKGRSSRIDKLHLKLLIALAELD